MSKPILYLKNLGIEQHLIAVLPKLLLILDAPMMYLFLRHTQAVLSQLKTFMALPFIMKLVMLLFVVKLGLQPPPKLLMNSGLTKC